MESRLWMSRKILRGRVPAGHCSPAPRRAGYIAGMFAVDRLLLIAAVLLIIGIASSKLSSRVGLPVLVLFLFVGMVAGSDGLGGIAFDDYGLAHGVGTMALAIILFDGGLRTDPTSFRVALAPSVVLATVGVLVTSLLVAGAAQLLLGLSPIEAILLGSIVGSTDAAAVFAVFRSKGMRVRRRVAATLEIESGSNDPMAVFLTIACLELLQGGIELGPGILWLFVRQMSVGGLVGWVVGRVTAVVINRIRLETAGLYPVLTGAAGLLAYGAAATAGGSGFLAVYLAGIVLGSRRLVFRRGVFLFHDGLAWLGQITMFVLLGLLSYPSRLADAAGPALLVTGVLMFVARPVAVALCLVPFRYSLAEMTLIAWGGLKGAVPIILATYPLLLGVAGAELLFDVVFFAVLVSAVSQGWTLPWVAGKLGLRRPPAPEPPVTLEITSLQDVDGDIIEYTLGADSRAAGRRVRDLALPEGAVIALIARGRQVIPPRGSTQILAGDHVFVLLRPGVRGIVDRVLSRLTGDSEPTADVDFLLRGATRVADLEEFYGVPLDAPGSSSLDEVLRERLGRDLEPGDMLDVGPVGLVVREVVDGHVETVGLTFRPGPAEEPAAGPAPD
jgi:potassium/hydrogen antiporter